MKTSAPDSASDTEPGRAQSAVSSASHCLTSSSCAAARVHDAAAIDDRDLGDAGGLEDLGDRHTGSAGTGDDDLDVLDVAIGDPQGVEQRSQDDDSRAVLVVVEDGDVETLDQPALDLEAARAGDVLEVDAAERRREPHDRLDDLVGIGRRQGDRDGVDAAELLEQHGLALHHRHRGGGTDVAEAEHGGAVGDDRDGVGDPGVFVGDLGIGRDGLAHLSHTGRVGHREIVGIVQRYGRRDRHLAAAVQREDGVVGVRRRCVHVDVSRNHGKPREVESVVTGPIRSPMRQLAAHGHPQRRGGCAGRARLSVSHNSGMARPNARVTGGASRQPRPRPRRAAITIASHAVSPSRRFHASRSWIRWVTTSGLRAQPSPCEHPPCREQLTCAVDRRAGRPLRRPSPSRSLRHIRQVEHGEDDVRESLDRDHDRPRCRAVFGPTFRERFWRRHGASVRKV